MSALEQLLQWQLPFYDSPPRSQLGSAMGCSPVLAMPFPEPLREREPRSRLSMSRNVFAACSSMLGLSALHRHGRKGRECSTWSFSTKQKNYLLLVFSSHLGNFDKTPLVCFHFFPVKRCVLYWVSFPSYQCFLFLSPQFCCLFLIIIFLAKLCKGVAEENQPRLFIFPVPQAFLIDSTSSV